MIWNPFSHNQEQPQQGDAKGQGGPPRSPLDALEANAAAGAGGPRVARNSIAEVQRIGETAVATFTVTELTQEKGVDLLADLLDELGQTGATHFILDIQNINFMDSACLGCLVEALNRMARSGGRIALANTANSVQYLFRMTQLDRVFPICADVMAALAAVERVPSAD